MSCFAGYARALSCRVSTEHYWPSSAEWRQPAASGALASVAEILVKSYLDRHLPGASDPDSNAPISEQEK